MGGITTYHFEIPLAFQLPLCQTIGLAQVSWTRQDPDGQKILSWYVAWANYLAQIRTSETHTRFPPGQTFFPLTTLTSSSLLACFKTPLANSVAAAHNSKLNPTSLVLTPVMGAIISLKTVSTPPPDSGVPTRDRKVSLTEEERKSPWRVWTAGIGSMGKISIAHTRGLEVDFLSTPNKWAATCDHPPGAAPRSTTDLVSLERIGWDLAIETSLKEERERYDGWEEEDEVPARWRT